MLSYHTRWVILFTAPTMVPIVTMMYKEFHSLRFILVWCVNFYTEWLHPPPHAHITPYCVTGGRSRWMGALSWVLSRSYHGNNALGSCGEFVPTTTTTTMSTTTTSTTSTEASGSCKDSGPSKGPDGFSHLPYNSAHFLLLFNLTLDNYD